MSYTNSLLALVVVCLVHGSYGATETAASHLKPFGWGTAIQMEEVEHFLPVNQFFDGKSEKIGNQNMLYKRVNSSSKIVMTCSSRLIVRCSRWSNFQMAN